jgi:hypothetical protein
VQFLQSRKFPLGFLISFQKGKSFHKGLAYFFTKLNISIYVSCFFFAVLKISDRVSCFFEESWIFPLVSLVYFLQSQRFLLGCFHGIMPILCISLTNALFIWMCYIYILVAVAGKAYSFEEPETSSDSEEDVLRRLQLPEPVPGPSSVTDSSFYHQQSTHGLTRKKCWTSYKHWLLPVWLSSACSHDDDEFCSVQWRLYKTCEGWFLIEKSYLPSEQV